MTVEFNKKVVTDKSGKVILDTSDLKIEDGKISGIAIDNLKRNIVDLVNNEIIKPENEAIKQELEEIKTAISNKNESLLKKALGKLIEKGTDKGLGIIVKIILAEIGINLP